MDKSLHPNTTARDVRIYHFSQNYFKIKFIIGATKHLLFYQKSVPNASRYYPADGENLSGLDLSDFPALADRSRREGTGNPTPVLNPLAGRAPYGKLQHFPFGLGRRPITS